VAGLLLDDLDRVAAEFAFSGVVRVDRAGEPVLEQAYGYADRSYEIPNRIDTRFGVASGLKSMTALAVVSLIEDGRLALDTAARAFLGEDLPLVADNVTVEHLLAHRSGIGDYLDEDEWGGAITDYVMPVPVHQLASAEDFLAVLDGHPTKFDAGSAFSYCNGGYVVLALLAERVSGVPYHDLVGQRVCEPAGMASTAFLRSDELPGDAARGYLEVQGLRTNVLHLPLRGTGDGGIHTTVADVSALWRALFDGRIVSTSWVTEMTRPRSEADDGRRYGLGFWLGATTDTVMLEGYDAGVSFRSMHDPASETTCTVIANWSDGAWPVVKHFAEPLLGF
jgi:CubicO group peptidase (beta-lactamase class C family)